MIIIFKNLKMKDKVQIHFCLIQINILVRLKISTKVPIFKGKSEKIQNLSKILLRLFGLTPKSNNERKKQQESY